MPRACTACTHPQREDIDHAIAHLRLSIRSIASRFGISSAAALRHRRHVAQALGRALERSGVEPEHVADRAARAARRIQRRFEAADEAGNVAGMLALSPEFRHWTRLYGEGKGQLASAATALYVNLGVQGEDEIRRALDLARAGERMSLDEMQESAVALLRDLCGREPGRRLAILSALGGAVMEAVDSVEAIEAGNGNVSQASEDRI